MQDGEVVFDNEEPRQNNTTRNIVIGVVVVLLLLCCCCGTIAALFSVAGSGGILDEIMQELEISALPVLIYLA